MARKSPPPPLNLSLDTRSKRLPQIARDQPMDVESKPLILMSAGASSVPGQACALWRTLRVACGFVHMLLSTALLLIVVLFLHMPGGLRTTQGPGAVALLVSLSLDITLSLLLIGLIEQIWRNCVLCMRLMITCGYMALLIASVLRGVFPETWMVWGLGPRASNTMALVFLGAIMLFNVAQAIIERQSLASFARQQVKRLGDGCSRGELVSTSSSAGTGSTGTMDTGRERATALSRL
ncbi:hypothetical protein HJFPF1_00977 [Paramyrothecium foliicola]|nr:hypothetical protein HJFPF1_00977 [Paramyrothecium foliicola]